MSEKTDELMLKAINCILHTVEWQKQQYNLKQLEVDELSTKVDKLEQQVQVLITIAQTQKTLSNTINLNTHSINDHINGEIKDSITALDLGSKAYKDYSSFHLNALYDITKSNEDAVNNLLPKITDDINKRLDTFIKNTNDNDLDYFHQLTKDIKKDIIKLSKDVEDNIIYNRNMAKANLDSLDLVKQDIKNNTDLIEYNHKDVKYDIELVLDENIKLAKVLSEL